MAELQPTEDQNQKSIRKKASNAVLQQEFFVKHTPLSFYFISSFFFFFFYDCSKSCKMGEISDIATSLKLDGKPFYWQGWSAVS